MAYASDESGNPEIYVQPYPPTGNRWQISTAGGGAPRWRGDGRELFYVARNRQLTAVALRLEPRVEVGKPEPLFPLDERDLVVMRDGQRFLVVMTPASSGVEPVQLVAGWPSRLGRGTD